MQMAPLTGGDLRVVFPDKELLSRVHDAAHEAELWVDVTAIYETEDPRHIHYGLTEKQRNTLVAAFEAGHFTVL